MNNTRITEIKSCFAGLGTQAGKRYTNQELVDNLLQLQSTMAKGVFEKPHAESLHDKDVLLHFETLAKEYGLDQTDAFCRFKQNMGMFGKTIGYTINGLKGEQSVRRALKLLSYDKDVQILYNVQLEDSDAEAEYDAIVIAPYGLFVLEVKKLVFSDGYRIEWDHAQK